VKVIGTKNMVRKRLAGFTSALVFSSALWLAGCSLLRPRPLETTSFLQHGSALMEKRERAPFNGIYVSDQSRWDALVQANTKVYFAEVNTKFAEERIKAMDLPSSIEVQRTEELTEMSRYLRERFKSAAGTFWEESQEVPATVEGKTSNPEAKPDMKRPRGFMVLDRPAPDGFVVELAIVEVVPTNPGIQALATLGGFFVPGGGLVRYLGTGSIAIEGIVKDGSTGEVLLEFKDREADKNTLFSVKDYQQYAHARQTIEEWSAQFAEVTSSTSDHEVDDAYLISVNPL